MQGSCFTKICIFVFLAVSRIFSAESILGSDFSYRGICEKAVLDDYYFENFRHLPEYSHALELPQGDRFAAYLENTASDRVKNCFSSFEALDRIGSPETSYYPGIGSFSGTTLRYITIADQISKIFSLRKDAHIVEIGAGFGGQCFVLSRLLSFSKYSVYDLPEVNLLIKKVLTQLEVPNICYPSLKNKMPIEADLVISNYAFSELSRDLQMEYFEKVVKNCTSGYMIFNQIASQIFGLDSLTPAEFVALLKASGKNPTILKEPISTYSGNILIVWGYNNAL